MRDAGKAGSGSTRRCHRGRVCAGGWGATGHRRGQAGPERRKPPCDTRPGAWAAPSSPSGNGGLSQALPPAGPALGGSAELGPETREPWEEGHRLPPMTQDKTGADAVRSAQSPTTAMSCCLGAVRVGRPRCCGRGPHEGPRPVPRATGENHILLATATAARSGVQRCSDPPHVPRPPP